jgi:3-oxoacyl-[acyl-carrier protein] reductase
MMASATDLRKAVNINIESQIALSRMSLRIMSASGWGRIVFIGSRAGSVGLPGQAAYASTKGALSAWAASVAGEVGKKGITVNVVAPGAIEDAQETVYSPEEQEKVCDRIGAGRLGKAGEVASVVSFLCSTNAGYINGATIAVDGGARF